MNKTALMTDPIPVRHLFETHLTVSDLQRSIGFYRDVVGLKLAFEASERNVAFLWIGESGRSMLGLWSLGTTPLGLILHLAFDVALDDLLEAPKRLKTQGIKPLSFFGIESAEPSVISWMPAASVYFRDPDGHMLEYLSMLDKEPRPHLGIIPWSEWIGTELIRTSHSHGLSKC
jgi:lactoylglutathione lyase